MVISKENLTLQFGKHIRDLRLKKGLTQLELAAITGKDRQSIQRVESGNVNSTLYYMYELAEGLETDLATLIAFGSNENKS
ncbi:helix-turn-helix domain-containing protein [Pedobacter sp.]